MRRVARSKWAEFGHIPSFGPRNVWNGDTRWNRQLEKYLVTPTGPHQTAPRKHGNVSHTIFEGTSEIQQLVIARAISGLRVE